MNEQVILPLVHRHVEDSAFYWMQLEDAANNPRMSATTQLRFEELLDAHLDGLAIAGAAATPVVLAALNRWRTRSEVFVAAWHALYGGHHVLLSQVMALVVQQPREYLRALVSALALLPTERAQSWVTHWLEPGSSAELQVAALRAIKATDSLRPPGGDALLVSLLSSANAEVRAAACRLADTVDRRHLEMRLDDPELTVRAEAALTTCWVGDRNQGLATLWSCIVEQVHALADSPPEQLQRHERRLNRWLGLMAQWMPVGHAAIPDLLHFLPSRCGLLFTLHHGDPALLPWVAELFNDPITSRFAAWVWACLTGVDLAANQLVRSDETVGDEPLEAQRDAERGLALPDPRAIAEYSVRGLPVGERSLLGRPLELTFALGVMASDACTRVRQVAAGWLACQGLTVPPRRSPLRLQRQWVGAIQAAPEHESFGKSPAGVT